MNSIKDIFKIEKKPRKGLLAVEWVVLGYMLLTTLIILFTYTKAINPESMLWGRFRILVIIAALWAVYRLVPCRFTLFCRIGVHLALLSWWYPDTYEINRVLPNLDPIFATWEQQLFGCQPALLFYEAVPSVFFSELMLMGYASYYPMIGVVALYYFFRRYQDFERITFIILASFFIYYVIFVALPVTGPQYYYHAAGLDNIVKGVFPDIGNYFATHQDKLPIPGSPNGFFHQLMEAAHETGERPTAAFPSSHVGVTLILLLLAWHTRSWRLTLFVLFFFLLMCMATVYIRAHYVIDVVAGIISAVIIYPILFYFRRI
jgi:membrane-associated phospholipid phosphatase